MTEEQIKAAKQNPKSERGRRVLIFMTNVKERLQEREGWEREG